MTLFSVPRRLRALTLAALALCATSAAWAQTTATARATELRADKLSGASVVANLAAGAKLRVLSIEGGWAMVEWSGKTGWLRASALNLQAGISVVSSGDTGRQASGDTPNAALTLGVRGLPERVNRHALIIGISRYADPATPPLPGARIDKQSATQMAQAMQVPLSNIHYLQDDQATGDGIRHALQELTEQVQEGDRVFIHYSGHGTRFNDPASGGCVEALYAYDGGQSGTLTNREMVSMLKTITNKTDKLFVMYDACHSGGVGQAATAVRTRGFGNSNDEGVLRPKFASISEECGRPVNVKTRNLVVEATAKGALPQDIIHVSAARDNEISFDDEQKGGLATQYMRDCMLRDAKDLDNSGAISMDEIRQCAQEKIDKRMAHDANYKPHNLVLTGNASFVPAWFALPAAAPVAAIAAVAAVAPTAGAAASAARPPVAAPTPSAAASAARPAPAPTAVVAAPAPLTGEQGLRQMFDQRDAKRQMRVTAAQDKLKIGKDALALSVLSDHAGYVYVALAGSDNKSVYLLFPNELDTDNKISAGQQMLLPRPSWNVKAGGPVGMDQLLVMVSDGPRNLSALAANKAGPFVTSLNDAKGRAQLGALMSNSDTAGREACATTAKRVNNPLCSDAYGAAMLAVEEVK